MNKMIMSFSMTTCMHRKDMREVGLGIVPIPIALKLMEILFLVLFPNRLNILIPRIVAEEDYLDILPFYSHPKLGVYRIVR